MTFYLAVDVHYGAANVCAACVGFGAPQDVAPVVKRVEKWATPAEPYEPGHFWRRELPYVQQLVQDVLSQLNLGAPGLLLVDGYVWLGDAQPGLGLHVHEAFDRMFPVVGVAKTRFHGAPAAEVLRGQSRAPLFVTSVGILPAEAQEFVQLMHGSYRLPTMLRLVDALSRGR